MARTTNRARNRDLHLRLNEREYRAITENARRLKTTPAALMRALIALPIETQAESMKNETNAIVTFDRTAIANLAKQIRMWGYHYDQAVHALNIIAARKFMRPEDAAHYMKKATSLLEEIEETRGELENEMLKLTRRTFAHLPLGRES